MIDFKNAEYLKLVEVDPRKGAQQVDGMLIPGEQVIACFKGVRDGVVFTNKRVIAFNVQGITGKKTVYTSLPYKRVQAFSIGGIISAYPAVVTLLTENIMTPKKATAAAILKRCFQRLTFWRIRRNAD